MGAGEEREVLHVRRGSRASMRCRARRGADRGASRIVPAERSDSRGCDAFPAPGTAVRGECRHLYSGHLPHHDEPTTMIEPTATDCPLCRDAGGDVLFRDDRLRVVHVADADHPGFLRVIWTQHVREMTDLEPVERSHCMRTVMVVESALRDVLRPDKINLASFGNMVPHVHWHVIPRFVDDPHFPNAVWGERVREGARPLPPAFREAIVARLSACLGPTPQGRTDDAARRGPSPR